MKAAIIGMGKSGNAAERLLRARGVDDIATFDDKTSRPISEYIDGDYDIVVISPGINPNKIPNYPKKFTSEIQLGLENLPTGARTIAITGTDGKSTTTTLCAQLLNAAGHTAVACGNFGYPLCDAVLDCAPGTIFIIELSSYQIDLLPARPYFDAAAILNIAPDHLDRYFTMEKYTAAKRRISEMLRDRAKFFDIGSCAPPLSPPACGGSGAGRAEGGIVGGLSRECATGGGWDGFPLPGAHNRANLGYAVALARAVAPMPDDLSPLMPQLTGLEHRIEPVPTNDGIHWYNDSKGTTVQAVLCALTSFDHGVILMLGGRDKNLDFTPLAPEINARCDAVVLFGEAAEKINSQIAPVVTKPIIRATNLRDAVERARAAAHNGNTILLSPGCTSWDEFKDFEERGNKFKEYVTRNRD